MYFINISYKYIIIYIYIMHIIYSVLLFVYRENMFPVDFPFNLHPLEQSLDVLRVRSLAQFHSSLTH